MAWDSSRPVMPHVGPKLNETDYLEGLARQELAYAKPGEDVYIETGGPAGSKASPPATDTAPAVGAESSAEDQPGFFERLLTGFLDLF